MAKSQKPGNDQENPVIQSNLTDVMELASSPQAEYHRQQVTQRHPGLRSHIDRGRRGTIRMWVMKPEHPISSIEGKNAPESEGDGS